MKSSKYTKDLLIQQLKDFSKSFEKECKDEGDFEKNDFTNTNKLLDLLFDPNKETDEHIYTIYRYIVKNKLHSKLTQELVDSEKGMDVMLNTELDIASFCLLHFTEEDKNNNNYFADLKNKIEKLQESAEGGDVSSQFKLAESFYNVEGISECLEKVNYWVNKAFETDEFEALNLIYHEKTSLLSIPFTYGEHKFDDFIDIAVYLANKYPERDENGEFSMEAYEINSSTSENPMDNVNFCNALNKHNYDALKIYDKLETDHTISHQKQTIEERNIELELLNISLKEKDRELEELMSMFAHKFRSPLDTIIYNTSHEMDSKLYIEAAQTMRGLLDIFSLISTDDVVLTKKLRQDSQGNSNLTNMFSKTLDMVLIHLLSSSGTEKIHQHYISYAKKQGKIDINMSSEEWEEDHFELEKNLQIEWEKSFSLLISESASLEQRLDWIESHFFKLEILGFYGNSIQFKEYSITESFLTIIVNEILINIFKYYSSDNMEKVTFEWSSNEDYQVLICNNPTNRRERSIIKGSHKGHSFLSSLARKTGSIFEKPKLQDNFTIEFKIPKNILIV